MDQIENKDLPKTTAEGESVDAIEKTETPEEMKNESPSDQNALETNSENSQDKIESKINDEEITDAMMENLQENFNRDVDSMVSLMESAEDFMFETDSKMNIKAAIEANKKKEQEQKQKSAINSDKSEAYSLLAQGKRNLFVKDYESAVTTLGEACQKLCSIYGEFALELGDAYMTYGNALLELWRIEEAEKNNGEGGEEGTNEETEEVEEVENKEEEEEKKDDGEGDGEEKNDEEDEEKNEDGEEDIENEEDNLQIAWEVVEIAKEIYVKHNDNANLAKAYAKLGEISIASSNHNLAIEDLNRSLEVQSKLDSVDSRLKANTHFNLYVAYVATHNYDKSAEQLDIAKSIFQSQAYDLDQKLKTLDESKVSERTKITSEINDIEDILKDMDSKVLENNRYKREFINALVEAIKNKTGDDGNSSSANGFESGSSTAENTTQVVNNINHLVHKKPKPKLEESKSENLEKQITTSQNVDVQVNGKVETNGLNNDDKIKDKKRKLSESNESNTPKKPCLKQD